MTISTKSKVQSASLMLALMPLLHGEFRVNHVLVNGAAAFDGTVTVQVTSPHPRVWPPTAPDMFIW